MFGLEEVENGKKLPVQHDDIVTLMLIGYGFPYKYIKELEKINEERKKETEDIGKKFIPIKPSHRDGGVTYRAVMLSVNNQSIPFTKDSIVYFDAPTPDWIYATPNMSFKFEKGGGYSIKNGKPNVVNLLPSAKPAVKYEDGKKIDISELDLTDKFVRQQYADLVSTEEQRVAQWEAMLKYWDNIDEDTALKDLHTFFARTRFLCRISDGKVKYVEPALGVTFTAKANIYKGYLGFDSVGFYDRDSKSFPIYSTCNVQDPTDEDVAYAEQLLDKEANLRKEAYTKKEIPKAPADQSEGWGDDE